MVSSCDAGGFELDVNLTFFLSRLLPNFILISILSLSPYYWFYTVRPLFLPTAFSLCLELTRFLLRLVDVRDSTSYRSNSPSPKSSSPSGETQLSSPLLSCASIKLSLPIFATQPRYCFWQPSDGSRRSRLGHRWSQSSADVLPSAMEVGLRIYRLSWRSSDPVVRVQQAGLLEVSEAKAMTRRIFFSLSILLPLFSELTPILDFRLFFPGFFVGAMG